jgi:hypothetical protein
MPALENVRWERFCQAIVHNVAKHGQKYSQGRAYIEAGYNSKPGDSAYANASRLVVRDKIAKRIAELLHEAQQKATNKRAYTINEVTDRMALASKIAEEDRNPSALTNAEKAIAEVRGLVVNKANGDNNLDFKQAKSIARRRPKIVAIGRLCFAFGC